MAKKQTNRLSQMLERFSRKATEATGTSTAFIIAVLVIVVWIVTGPLFHFSDTWQLVINDNVIRQHGAIQMKTSDGALKLFPLIDKSDITINIADTFANNKGWIGAVYYKIIQTGNSNQFFTPCLVTMNTISAATGRSLKCSTSATGSLHLVGAFLVLKKIQFLNQP